MTKLIKKETQNPTILKFEFEDFITQNENFEFKNISTRQKHLHLHNNYSTYLRKTVYISGNFIAIEKFSIVEWDDVKDAVAEQIATFVDNGGTIITVDENKVKQPITVYGESTPNPSALKFVVSRMLTKTAIEFKKY
jgi:hypothetical protein